MFVEQLVEHLTKYLSKLYFQKCPILQNSNVVLKNNFSRFFYFRFQFPDDSIVFFTLPPVKGYLNLVCVHFLSIVSETWLSFWVNSTKKRLRDNDWRKLPKPTCYVKKISIGWGSFRFGRKARCIFSILNSEASFDHLFWKK